MLRYSGLQISMKCLDFRKSNTIRDLRMSLHEDKNLKNHVQCKFYFIFVTCLPFVCLPWIMFFCSSLYPNWKTLYSWSRGRAETSLRKLTIHYYNSTLEVFRLLIFNFVQLLDMDWVEGIFYVRKSMYRSVTILNIFDRYFKNFIKALK